MPQQSPPAAPTATAVTTADLGIIAKSQRLVLASIVGQAAVTVLYVAMASIGLHANVDWVAMHVHLENGAVLMPILIVAMVLGIIGTHRMVHGFGFRLATRMLLIAAMFIPVVGLFSLLDLNVRATWILRAGGYRVGLLGAAI